MSKIIVTSDHGRNEETPFSHGGQSEQERTIPVILSSRELNQGTFLESAGVSQADIAPTVLGHFGVETPAHYWGTSRAAGVEVSADFNSDGSVDGDDLLMWQDNFGIANAAGDANHDGAVNGGDFLIWQRTFTGSSTIESVSVVPEPASLIQFLIGLLTLSSFGKRR